MAAVPLSISRAVFFQFVLSFTFSLVYGLRQPKLIGKILMGAVIFILLALALSFVPFFKIAQAAFTDRFENANRIEGGVEGVFIDRFLGGMWGALINQETPIAGQGLGMGTNAGARLMSAKGFLISEGEWGRLIGEMGFFLGSTLILVRSSLTLRMFSEAWTKLSDADPMPWLLFSFSSMLLLQGQWAQPTALGFGVFGTGITLAALQQRPKAN